MQYDVIVIGAGPAGNTASIYTARKGLKTLVIGKDVGGQAAISGDIENYLGFTLITGPELAMKFREHVEHFSEIEFKEGLQVTDLKQVEGGFEVIDSNSVKYTAKVVIIASGREPKWLNIPGEDKFKGKGVSACATCDGPLFRNKDVAVIGGGNSGLEATELLIKFANKVYLINRGDKLAGDEILQKKVQASDKVEIIHNASPKEVKGDKMVSQLIVKDSKTGKDRELEVQGVFVEIGYKPSAHFDKITEKDKAGAIIVNSDLETNIPGLYAAGDVNDLWGEQIIISAGEGAKAAMRAAQYLSKKDNE